MTNDTIAQHIEIQRLVAENEALFSYMSPTIKQQIQIRSNCLTIAELAEAMAERFKND